MFSVRVDDLGDERVQDLLRLHLRGMHAHSPPGAVFALDISGLRRPGITAWTAWHGAIPWHFGFTILTNDLLWWVPFGGILLAAHRSAGQRA